MSQMSSSALINKGEVAVKRETHWTLLNAPESDLNLNGVAITTFASHHYELMWNNGRDPPKGPSGYEKEIIPNW